MEISNPSMEKNPAESSTSAPSEKPTSLDHYTIKNTMLRRGNLSLWFEDELSNDEDGMFLKHMMIYMLIHNVCVYIYTPEFFFFLFFYTCEI